MKKAIINVEFSVDLDSRCVSFDAKKIKRDMEEAGSNNYGKYIWENLGSFMDAEVVNIKFIDDNDVRDV